MNEVIAQNQLEPAIGIFEKALPLMMNTQDAKTMAGIFRPIKDARRLLIDMHHCISKTRRYYSTFSSDAQRKAVAKESPIYQELFGEGFSAKLKALKDSEQSAKEISKRDDFRDSCRDNCRHAY